MFICVLGTWVQCCSRSCKKWRYLCDVSDPSVLPENWFCNMNNGVCHLINEFVCMQTFIIYFFILFSSFQTQITMNVIKLSKNTMKKNTSTQAIQKEQWYGPECQDFHGGYTINGATFSK